MDKETIITDPLWVAACITTAHYSKIYTIWECVSLGNYRLHKTMSNNKIAKNLWLNDYNSDILLKPHFVPLSKIISRVNTEHWRFDTSLAAVDFVNVLIELEGK